VPIVTPSTVRLSRNLAMSRTAAFGLVRRAVHAATGRPPRDLGADCHRRTVAAFSCRAAWDQAGSRWRGTVGVWYRLIGRDLRWYYNLSALRHPDGQRLVATGRPSGTRVAHVTIAHAWMLCHAPPLG
jgi:hypothetical protein